MSISAHDLNSYEPWSSCAIVPVSDSPYGRWAMSNRLMSDRPVSDDP